jgi:hypothetical protein
MKRFLLFAFNQYYPAGGMGDCEGDYDTFDEAKADCEKRELKSNYEYVYIFDIMTGDLMIFNQ